MVTIISVLASMLVDFIACMTPLLLVIHIFPACLAASMKYVLPAHQHIVLEFPGNLVRGLCAGPMEQ